MVRTLIPFTKEELALNQAGSLSEKQQKMLLMTAQGVKTASRRTIIISSGFTILGLLIISAMFLQNSDARTALFSQSSNLIAIIALLGVIAVILSLSQYMARQQATKLAKGKIFSVDGVVRLDETYNPGAAFHSYHLIVGRKKFSFTQKLEPYFKVGQTYRVYYVKAGIMELLLSYEKVISNKS